MRVLQRNGYTVHFPRGQTCCGAAQLHVGGGDLARELARRNIDAFLDGEYLAIISNAGGCGATLRDEYPGLLAGDPAYADRAVRFAGLVQDVSEFLAQHLNVPPAGTVRAARDLLRLMPPAPCPEGRSSATRPAARHPRPGAGGAELSRPLLRQRGHLQHHPPGHGRCRCST